jgi:hypothetical protein
MPTVFGGQVYWCGRAIKSTTWNITQPSPATVKFVTIWNSLKQGVTFDRNQTGSIVGWTPSFSVTVLLNSTQSLQFGEVVGNRKSRADILVNSNNGILWPLFPTPGANSVYYPHC